MLRVFGVSYNEQQTQGSFVPRVDDSPMLTEPFMYTAYDSRHAEARRFGVVDDGRQLLLGANATLAPLCCVLCTAAEGGVLARREVRRLRSPSFTIDVAKVALLSSLLLVLCFN